MNEPLVSVLMTAYNREKYIAEAIGSVLASGFRDFELIVVDDGSTDRTVAIAREFESRDSRVRVFVNEKNLGDYPNRNRAASYAQGKYIKYLDSDDYMYPHCLEVMVMSMLKFPEAGYGLSSIGDASRPYPVCLTPRETYIEHFNGFGHFDRAPGSSIILKRAFIEVGGFSGKRMIGDNEMWMKLARNYCMVKFHSDLYWSRIHPGQESQADYATQYKILRESVLNEALLHPNCPLTREEIINIRKKYKRSNLKNLLLRLIK